MSANFFNGETAFSVGELCELYNFFYLFKMQKYKKFFILHSSFFIFLYFCMFDI